MFEKYKDIYLNKLLIFREFCTKIIGKDDIKLCIENCDGYKEFMKEGIELLLESEVFVLTWDMGHDFCIDNKDSNFIYKNINRVRYMHIRDTIGTKNHLPLGSGKIHIYDKLRIAKKNNCRCVLETKTIKGLKKSVKYTNNRILR